MDKDKKLHILNKLKLHQSRQELVSRQKSREDWLKASDKNTKFFHMSTLIRRRRNRISVIKYNQNWIHDEQEISEFFTKHFKELSYMPTRLNQIEWKVLGLWRSLKRIAEC